MKVNVEAMRFAEDQLVAMLKENRLTASEIGRLDQLDAEIMKLKQFLLDAELKKTELRNLLDQTVLAPQSRMKR